MAAAQTPRSGPDASGWDALPGSVARLGTDGALLDANGAFRAAFPAEAARWREALTPESRDALQAALAAHADFRLVLRLQAPARHAPGAAPAKPAGQAART